ncbi:MAG: acetyl-CoA carboxylase biotin carboxyl carrier protein subunit [Ferruginibacter sp.]
MPAMQKTYKIKTNDFFFTFGENKIKEIDLVQKSPSEFNCIKDNRSVNGHVLETDLANKKFKIAIEGEIFSVEIQDALDQMIERMSQVQGGNKKHTDIKAPMPGLVLEIAVADGQQAAEGEKILILQAMKMENSIVMPANATIKKIMVSKGQVVERGQVLVELE